MMTIRSASCKILLEGPYKKSTPLRKGLLRIGKSVRGERRRQPSVNAPSRKKERRKSRNEKRRSRRNVSCAYRNRQKNERRD